MSNEDEHTVAPLPESFEGVENEQVDVEGLEKLIHNVLSVQRPVVVHQIRALRTRHANDTPAQLIERIENQYRSSATVAGGAIGATAAAPGLGTALSLGLSGAEVIGFLEMTALYSLAMAEIHGLNVSDPVRARTLVMSIMLGDAAKDVIKRFSLSATGRAPSANARMGEIIASFVPASMVGPLGDAIQSAFVKKYTKRIGASAVGRAVPFGIGAVVGGAANRAMATAVIASAHRAFGPAPSVFPMDLSPDPDNASKRKGLFFTRRKSLESGSDSVDHASDESATKKKRRRRRDR